MNAATGVRSQPRFRVRVGTYEGVALVHRYRVPASVFLTILVAAALTSTAAAGSQAKAVKFVTGETAYWAESPSSPPNNPCPFMSSPYDTTADIQQFQDLMYRPLYWMGTGPHPI